MKQLLTLAVFLVSLSIFSQNEKVDELTVQLAYKSLDSTKVDMSLMLIDELYSIENHTKALLYVNQTAKLAEELKYTKGLAESSYYRALIYAKRNDYFNAIDNYSKSRKYYLLMKDTLGVAKVSNSIGLIEIKRGNYAIGLQNSLSAIDIFEKQNLKDELSAAYNNLAEAYYKTNQIDKSIDFNFKALEIRKEINDKKGIKLSTKNIAELYSILKEHRKAIEYYEKALNLLDLETDQDLRGEILPKLGNEYLQFKEYDKASKLLTEGLKYNREQKNEEGILRALNAIGNLNLQQKKVNLAEEQLNEAYKFALKVNNKKELLENYRLHIALDSTRGDFQNAFIWQNKYHYLKDSLTLVDKPVFPTKVDPLNLEESKPSKEHVNTQNITTDTTNSSWLKSPLLFYSAIAIAAIALTLFFFSLLNTNKHKQSMLKQKEELEKERVTNKAILEQTQHLEEVNQVKDKLFSIVSHDLKDSISSIKAFLDLLKEDSISKDEFYELIPELSDNANNASSLLFNLLNWSKSQMQNLEPKPELFDIQEVFHTKMALVDKKIEDKRIILIDESQKDFIYADKSMIEIVIQNLITNAVKFSRTGDVITISNQNINGKILLCIKDTGVGISKENIDKLFNASKNFTTIGTKNEKGTGLGLTIAKDLVELNNGKIWVESTLNVGSKFFIELPRSSSRG